MNSRPSEGGMKSTQWKEEGSKKAREYEMLVNTLTQTISCKALRKLVSQIKTRPRQFPSAFPFPRMPVLDRGRFCREDGVVREVWEGASRWVCMLGRGK